MNGGKKVQVKEISKNKEIFDAISEILHSEEFLEPQLQTIEEARMWLDIGMDVETSWIIIFL